jgi:hypothetical protein
MAALDTTARAAAIQLEHYRAAGPSRRAQIAVDLSDAVRETTLAGIRRRHPDYTEREMARSFLQLVYGIGIDRERHGRFREAARRTRSRSIEPPASNAGTATAVVAHIGLIRVKYGKISG